MLEVYRKRTFIEIDTNLQNISAIFSNVVFKENAYCWENEKKFLLLITLNSNRCWNLKDFRDQVSNKSAPHNFHSKRLFKFLPEYIMHTYLAIISTQRIKATKNRTCQNKGKYVLKLMYQSHSD